MVRILTVALVLLSGCAFGGGESFGPGARIVTSFYPLTEIANRVSGGLNVQDLTPSGAEPHGIELRPNDLSLIRRAALVIYIGGGFQPAIEDALRSAPRVRALDVLEALPVRGKDTHVWLDPVLMQRMVAVIAPAIAKVRPADAAAIEARAKAYGNELKALDAEFRARLRSCARRELFTSHAAFGYLAARYGLKQVAVAGLSPESEPSPKRLEEVTKQVRATGATTIFFETLVGSRVAEAIARATGTGTAVLNPIEGLTLEERRNNENYVTVMRKNLAAISEGLSCRTK